MPSRCLSVTEVAKFAFEIVHNNILLFSDCPALSWNKVIFCRSERVSVSLCHMCWQQWWSCFATRVQRTQSFWNTRRSKLWSSHADPGGMLWWCFLRMLIYNTHLSSPVTPMSSQSVSALLWCWFWSLSLWSSQHPALPCCQAQPSDGCWFWSLSLLTSNESFFILRRTTWTRSFWISSPLLDAVISLKNQSFSEFENHERKRRTRFVSLTLDQHESVWDFEICKWPYGNNERCDFRYIPHPTRHHRENQSYLETLNMYSFKTFQGGTLLKIQENRKLNISVFFYAQELETANFAAEIFCFRFVPVFNFEQEFSAVIVMEINWKLCALVSKKSLKKNCFKVAFPMRLVC